MKKSFNSRACSCALDYKRSILMFKEVLEGLTSPKAARGGSRGSPVLLVLCVCVESCQKPLVSERGTSGIIPIGSNPIQPKACSMCQNIVANDSARNIVKRLTVSRNVQFLDHVGRQRAGMSAMI
jgi:hypothetical protein